MEREYLKEDRMEGYKNKVRTFIVENFLFGNADGLEDNTSLLDKGIIDSTGVLEMVGFLSDEFSITIEDDELVPENFDSIEKVATYLQKKLNDMTSATANGKL